MRATAAGCRARRHGERNNENENENHNNQHEIGKCFNAVQCCIGETGPTVREAGPLDGNGIIGSTTQHHSIRQRPILTSVDAHNWVVVTATTARTPRPPVDRDLPTYLPTCTQIDRQKSAMSFEKVFGSTAIKSKQLEARWFFHEEDGQPMKKSVHGMPFMRRNLVYGRRATGANKAAVGGTYNGSASANREAKKGGSVSSKSPDLLLRLFKHRTKNLNEDLTHSAENKEETTTTTTLGNKTESKAVAESEKEKDKDANNGTSPTIGNSNNEEKPSEDKPSEDKSNSKKRDIETTKEGETGKAKETPVMDPLPATKKARTGEDGESVPTSTATVDSAMDIDKDDSREDKDETIQTKPPSISNDAKDSAKDSTDGPATTAAVPLSKPKTTTTAASTTTTITAATDSTVPTGRVSPLSHSLDDDTAMSMLSWTRPTYYNRHGDIIEDESSPMVRPKTRVVFHFLFTNDDKGEDIQMISDTLADQYVGHRRCPFCYFDGVS